MEEENIRSYYVTWKQNGNTSPKDYTWFTFNMLLTEVAKTPMSLGKFYEYQREIYLSMLYFRIKVEGKKDNHIVQRVYEARIKCDVETLPFEFDVKVSSNNCCAYCNSLE